MRNPRVLLDGICVAVLASHAGVDGDGWQHADDDLLVAWVDERIAGDDPRRTDLVEILDR